MHNDRRARPRPRRAGARVRVAARDERGESQQIAAAVAEAAREEVEELGVRGGIRVAQVVHRLDEAAPEELLPDPVRDRAVETQRIAVEEPIGEGLAAIGPLGDRGDSAPGYLGFASRPVLGSGNSPNFARTTRPFSRRTRAKNAAAPK